MRITEFISLGLLVGYFAAVGITAAQAQILSERGYEVIRLGTLEFARSAARFESAVNTPIPGGVTPLMVLAREGDVQGLDVALNHGAKIEALAGSGSYALAEALAAGPDALGCVSRLLRAGANVNRGPGDSHCPMWYALKTGNHAGFNVLLEDGACTDACSENDWNPPLRSAVAFNDIDVGRILIIRGARRSLVAPCAITLLNELVEAHHYSRIRSVVPWVKLLVGAGMSPDVSATAEQSEWQFTALMMAESSGDTELFDCLLDSGAHVNACTPLGETALMVAVQNGRADFARALLRRGAVVSYVDEHDDSALTFGCMYPDPAHFNVVKLLLSHGAKSRGADLELAARCGAEDAVNLIAPLITDSAALNSAALIAARHCYVSALAAIAAQIPRTTLSGDFGADLLGSALETRAPPEQLEVSDAPPVKRHPQGLPTVITMIISFGLNVRRVRLDGQPAIDFALTCATEASAGVDPSYVAACTALEAGGAETPSSSVSAQMLVAAAGKGMPGIELWLLEHGADANAVDRAGRLPIVSAVRMAVSASAPETLDRYLSTISTLLDHDANVNSADASGESAISIAIRGHELKLIGALRNAGMSRAGAPQH